MPSLVLGSASPRRAALLRDLGVGFTVSVGNTPEVAAAGESADDFARRMAREKGAAVGRSSADAWVLSADTIVVLDGAILGKPADADEARRMLRALSGRSHEVVTAAALTAPEGRLAAELLVRSAVTFRPLTDEEIDAYVAGGCGRVRHAGRRIVHERGRASGRGSPGDAGTLRPARRRRQRQRGTVADVTAMNVGAALAAVRARIAAAAARAGRDPDSIRLVAVSKTKSAELVRAAIDAGARDIGENYVQEASAKRAVVGDGATWHLIGHLQRNKVARALETFDVIQTVDSVALAETIARHAAARGRSARILVEVKIGGEASKTGVTPDALPELLVRLRDPQLEVEGLMTVPPPAPPDLARRYFRELRGLRDAAGLRELSMGMTDDFEIAIEEGATIVRVGRAIFGER
jgi:MAF protein